MQYCLSAKLTTAAKYLALARVYCNFVVVPHEISVRKSLYITFTGTTKPCKRFSGKFFVVARYVNCDAHNPQSSPTAMPAPFQGAYIKFVVIAKVKLYSTIISSLKGKVAASFSEQTEGLRYAYKKALAPQY